MRRSPTVPSPPSVTRPPTTATDGGTGWPSLSRVGLSEVSAGLGSTDDDQGTRLIAADCGGVRVISVYVPNGRSLDSEHYPAKLAWLARLRVLLDETELTRSAGGRVRRLQRGARGPRRVGPGPVRGR